MGISSGSSKLLAKLNVGARFRTLLLLLKNPDRASTLSTIINRLNLGWQIKIARVDRENMKMERSIFSQRSSVPVLEEQKGYFRREILPADENLAEYYRNVYWTIRGGKSNGVHERDINHFLLISKFLPHLISRGNTALNFGAGHGGISHLFWAAGMNVVNIEPSGLFNPYKERFSIINSLENLPDESVDIVYGCHSLEHVSDIEETRNLLNKKLKFPGWMFWQTPHAELTRAFQKERFVMPTNKNYLFEGRFFSLWMENLLLDEVVTDADEGNRLQSQPLRRVLGSVFLPG